MESYRVAGVPTSGAQRGYAQPARTARPQSNGSGTYGLSIRVQGIDGHPYVVLNNQDRGAHPNSNGYMDSEGSFIDHYQEYEFRGDKDAGLHSPFIDFRSQNMMQHSGSQNGVGDGKRSSNLLNFQKHPELLQPYDPDTNTLNLHGFHSLPSKSQTETGNSSSTSSHVRSSSLTKKGVPADPARKPLPFQSQTEDALQKPKSLSNNQPQVAQPQSKPRLSNPPQAKLSSRTSAPFNPASFQTPSSGSNASSDQSKASQCRSPSSVSSTSSSLERSRREPDVLPLRKVDSSGPVLQSTSRSRHSSSSSSSKAFVDDMEALYADTINRHENRRYIPFSPGSGRDIDTGSIPGVDQLIEKFDGKDVSHQRRGRAGRRNRINPEDRKRSHSVDSALGLRKDSSYLDEFSQTQGTSREHVLRPSLLRLQRRAESQDSLEDPSGSRRPYGVTSAPGSPQDTISTGVGFIQGYRKPQSRTDATSVKVSTSSLSTSLSKSCSTGDKKSTAGTEVQATPDLLKGRQVISQQSHEETAKQILFNYLKDGSNDSDETTKRKVNLVFEKIQTHKSRATAGAQSDHKSVDITAQTKALQEQKVVLEREMAELKLQIEEQSLQKNHTDRKMTASLRELQQDVDRTTEDSKRLKDKLGKAENELQSTIEELFQVKMEREQYQTEIRDLQDQLSEMHDELDVAKKSAADGEKDAIMADMMQLKLEMQEVLLAKEDQEEVLRRRERELTALKGALKEEVAAHDQEVDKMKEQYEKEISRLQTSLEETKQSSTEVVLEKAEMEAAKGALEGQAGRLSQEAERLRKRAQELENEVAKLNRIIDEAKLNENRLAERVSRLEREKKHLEESLAEIKEQEEEMSRANRALTLRLEDVQRNYAKLSLVHKEMEERLQEEKDQKEQFKSMKNDIEEERRLLDRTVEKLQREMNDIVAASQSSTVELQEQINVYKEKNRRELSDLQMLLAERGHELDSYLQTAKTLQEELSNREGELQLCEEERREALLKVSVLEKNLVDMETEVRSNSHAKEDKSKQFKLMQDRIAQLELDLDEERQSGDQLMDRIDRGREQVEQIRNELLQERACRQDLECDKMALERQAKDLKGRVSHLEGSQKSSKEGLVTQLEERIQELEERLEGEERERANLQLVNRRLERKVKEVMMQVEEEHNTMQDQKDQLNLRLKALKRQMDEAEEEIDRLEHSKKKLQRDLDEQQEANEQLQSQLKTLRSEIRRKSNSAPLLNDDDDDDISTDGETYFSSSLGYKRSASQDNILSSFAL